MVQIGQPHDKRKFKRADKNAYYASKAAFEKPEVTSFPVCEVCGLECRGKTFAGSRDGLVICVECWNETV